MKNENSNVVNIGNRNVANMADFAERMSTGIAESKASTVIAGGQNLLRLLKSGEWVFGVSNEEVQEGSHWAINVMSLKHGWNCWSRHEGSQKNELLGEILVPMTDSKPAKPAPIQGFEYAEMRAFDLHCMDGVDEGMDVFYKINSVGGMRAVDGLLTDIMRQLKTDPYHSCPVVLLQVDSYPHPKWGKTYIPIFEIVDWVDMEGHTADGDGPAVEPPAEPASEPTATTAPEKPRKAALGADVPTTPKPTKKEPVTTAAARTGQRRRPGR
jgi:hypothetical protein